MRRLGSRPDSARIYPVQPRPAPRGRAFEFSSSQLGVTSAAFPSRVRQPFGAIDLAGRWPVRLAKHVVIIAVLRFPAAKVDLQMEGCLQFASAKEQRLSGIPFTPLNQLQL